MKPKVSIFGAGGMLGGDLVRLAPAGWTLYKHGHEIDICQRDLVMETLKSDSPDVIINAAGLSNVDACEKDPEAAYRVNADGPLYLADCASELDLPLIHLSTDYVFPGHPTKFYSEDDATDPLQIYGKSKERSEEFVRRWEKHYILRPSSLYGVTRPAHATRVIQAVKNRETVKIVTDMFCSPTYTGDLSRWIYQLIEKRPPFGTYHSVHKGVCSRWEFAQELCAQIGAAKPYPLEKITLEELKLPAERPSRPALSVKKWESLMGPLPSWQEGLKNFLKESK